MNCEICSAKLQESFLQKIIGTFVKDAKGKKHMICPQCQRTLKEKKNILEKL